MRLRAEKLRSRLAAGDAIDLRGHGKAGGGLILAVQAFAAAVSEVPGLDVQEWPLFSSARKGANVCAYLRLARGRVEDTSQVSEPDIVLLVNEAAAIGVDVAEGTEDALFIVNTRDSPEETAERYGLGGTVATIGGDDLGMKFLQRPLSNISVLAALVRMSGLVSPEAARRSLESRLHKRRLPERIVQANLALFDESFDGVRFAELPAVTTHRRAQFQGYGELPAGAQSQLRTSLANHTATYGRPGVRVEFKDPAARCNGCSLCVVQCPEGIIEFTPDARKGPIVHGARFADYCKVCRECVTACPLDLFTEVAVVAPREGGMREA